MKHPLPLLMVFSLAMIGPVAGETPAPVSPAVPVPAAQTQAAMPPGVKLAEAVSATTGLAISPLMGMGALGAWQWWHTPVEARASVPWHAHPAFWIPALLLVVLLASKEPVLYLLPGAKKPLDLLEVVENKTSALVAAPMVLHLAERAFGNAAAAGRDTGVVMAGLDPGATVLVTLGGLGLLALFFCVWMVSHAVNILILLSPSATLDMVMRGTRGMVLAAVTFSAALNPWIGLLVTVVVAVIAVRSFGWAWRLMIFGSTLAADFILQRKESTPDSHGRVRAFVRIPRGGLPRRTRGHLHLGPTGELTFTGRPLPWLPRKSLDFPARSVRLTRSLTGPDLYLEGESPLPMAMVSLPPRFTGAEEEIGRAFGMDATTVHPAARTWQAAVRWLQETLGGPRPATIRQHHE